MLPRPGDLVAKAPIVPAAAVIVGWLSGDLTGAWAGTVLIVALAFELLLYQARYILNDLRGLRLDVEYSQFKRRTRFPQPPEPSHIRAAVLVMFIRLLLVWLVAALWLDQPAARLLLIAALIVVAHTGIYEALKTWVSRRREAPLTMTTSRATVLVSVGVGYGLRACLGLALGLAGVVDPLLLGLAGIAFTALGSMFVTMVWAIDGLTQVPGATPSELPTTHTTRALHDTPHILPLMRQAGIFSSHRGLATEPIRPRPEPEPGRLSTDPFWHHRLLEEASPPGQRWNWWNWWNACFLIAACGRRQPRAWSAWAVAQYLSCAMAIGWRERRIL